MPKSTSSRIQATLLGVILSSCISVAFAATPTEQQAIVQTGNGGPEILKLETVPVAQPRDRQVLIRVYAAAVNPTDWKTRAGDPGYGKTTGSIVPGGDVSGVIVKLGPHVDSLKVGEAVFAVVGKDVAPMNGGYAHYTVAGIDDVVPKPRSMTYAEAAGLGIATITGIRAVNETDVKRGDRVLITGAAGGVGSAAVQAAKARGAYVIGTATATHDDYLKSLGVDQIIDYSQVKFEDQVSNLDAVIDTVGSDTALRAMKTLKKHGHYISVAARNVDAQCAAADIICAQRGHAEGVQKAIYEQVGALARAGKLKVKIDKSFPLAEAGQAQAFGAQGHTEGKIVLIVDPAHASRK